MQVNKSKCLPNVLSFLIAGLAGHPSDVVVCIAGLPVDVASALSKRLLAKGVSHDRQLFVSVI